jgi:uncharacterized membrane protein YhhN
MITALWVASILSALVYGGLLVMGAPSPLRTIIKMVPVASLALIAYFTGPKQGLALLLPAALALSAVGDGFLAGEPKKWLPLGLVSFLIAHLIYVALFWNEGAPNLLIEPVRVVMIAAAVISGVGMLAWLWPHLGAMRMAVSAYVAAIVAMQVTSLLLPWIAWPVMVGALAFMASDAILSADLFRSARLAGSERFSAYSIWGLYYGGQAAIAIGLMRLGL